MRYVRDIGGEGIEQEGDESVVGADVIAGVQKDLCPSNSASMMTDWAGSGKSPLASLVNNNLLVDF